LRHLSCYQNESQGKDDQDLRNMEYHIDAKHAAVKVFLHYVIPMKYDALILGFYLPQSFHIRQYLKRQSKPNSQKMGFAGIFHGTAHRVDVLLA